MSPLSMQIEFTNYCNYACKFCPHAVYGEQSTLGGNVFIRRKEYMSQEVFDLALAAARGHAKMITIGFFGEQLLHPNFNEYVEAMHAGRPRYKTRFFTNFSRITAKNMGVVKRFGSVRISLDTLEPDRYDELYAGGPVQNWDGSKFKGRRGDGIISKMHDWFAMPKRPRTNIVYTTSSKNKHEIPGFLAYWRPHMRPADKITLKTVISYGGVMKDKHMTKNGCPIPWSDTKFTVAVNGDCTPCNLDVDIALSVGNIVKTPDVRKIINSAQYKRIKKQMQERKGICANCFDANNHRKTRNVPGTLV